MNESRAREEICRVGHSLFSRGYVHSTAGNISVRLDDAFLITPTEACLGFIDPAQIAKISLDGQHISGDRPSKTLRLHQRIYEAHDQAGKKLSREGRAGCVIHTHSTHLVALTLCQRYLPGVIGIPELLGALTPYFVMKVGRVPVVAYARPGATAVAETIANYIERYAAAGLLLRAVVIERLGPNVWASDPGVAMAVLEELEETARLATLSRHDDIRPVSPLSEDALDELRKTFLADW